MSFIRAYSSKYSNNILHVQGSDVLRSSPRGGTGIVNIYIPRLNVIYYTSEEWTGEYKSSGTIYKFTMLGSTCITIQLDESSVGQVSAFLKDWESQFKSVENIETADLLNV